MEHIVSPKKYLLIFAVLFVLALVTTGVAFIDLGPFNTVVAMAIAVTKAALVVLFFMHVKFERPITLVFAVAGFCWLAILLVLTFTDYYTRGWPPAPGVLPGVRF